MSRIAIVVHSVYPGDTRVRRQADALVGSGYGVDIFCLRRPGEPAEEDRAGIRIIRLPVNRSFRSFAGHMAEYVAFAGLAALRLTREHRSRRYALVQVANVPDFLAFSAMPVKLTEVPLLLDLHEDMPEFFRDRFGHPLLRPLFPLVTASARAAAAAATELITVHEPLRALSIGRGVPPEKIHVVMNSPDTEIFDSSAYRRRGFMEDGVLRLIHHSNLQRLYGLDVAVEALALLDESRYPWTLDVYGEGPYRGEIEAAAGRAGVADRVKLHGWADLEQMPLLLASADIGLVPSRDEPYLKYSLSQKLLEYAVMGVPTIATNLPTFRAHFTDAAVQFVPGGHADALAAAVEELAAEPDRAARMGVEAQRQALAYAWEGQARRYLAIVGRLIGSA